MKKKAILTLSLVVILLPFLGLPDSWKTVLFVILGLAIAAMAYRDEIMSFFSVSTPAQGRIVQGESFVESTGPGKTS